MNNDIALDHILAYLQKRQPVEKVKIYQNPAKIAAIMQQIATNWGKEWHYGENELKVIDQIFNGDKGLCLMGGLGNGKTTIFRLAAGALKTIGIDCEVINTRMFHALYQKNGEEEILSRAKGYLMIDDLGTEHDVVTRYGTKVDPMSTLLYLRYENRARTFVNTNLNREMMKAKYGERLADRFKEMFEYRTFYGESKR